MRREKIKVLNVVLSAAIAFSTIFAPIGASAQVSEGYGKYILGDGSGGGGGGASGSSLAGGAGGNGGGDDDTIAGTDGNDVIFGDGSGGGAGCRSVGSALNPRGGTGGGGADTINGGAGDDIIFGDGFNGQDYMGWYPGNGGIGGGGAGGSGGVFGEPPTGGIGGIGGGGGGAGGSGNCYPGATLVPGVGNPGDSRSGYTATNGGNSAAPAGGEAGAGGAAADYGGGGGAGFGGAAGGNGGSGSNGSGGADGSTQQYTYDDITGSIHGYFTQAVLRTILTNNPTFGRGNDIINGGAGNNNLFGLGGINTFIVDSEDNAVRNVIWDFKYGDRLLLNNNGTLVSEFDADSILDAAIYGDFDGDNLGDDTRITFNSTIIDLIDVVLTTENNVGTGGEISPPNSAPTILLNNHFILSDFSAANINAIGWGIVNDRDGDQEWDGGTLEVQITSNAHENDRLGVYEETFITPVINISGTTLGSAGVNYGTLPATVATGADIHLKYLATGGTKLTASFNSNATNELVRRVVNMLIFNTSASGSGNRTITVTLTDRHGNSSMDTVEIGAPASPVFTGAATDSTGSVLYVTFDKNMMGNPAGRQGQFDIIIDGVTTTAVSVSNSNSDATLEFNLATPVLRGQTVQVAYDQGSVTAADTGALLTFGPQPVTNNVITAPGAPLNAAAAAGNGQATVSFEAPSDGGSPITGYIVTASPGGITATANALSVTISGLTNGVAYTFKVKAVNAVGEGPESSATSAVTPSAPAGGGVSEGGTPVSDTGIEILVNGKAQNAATATMSKIDNRSVLTFAVDEKKLEQKIEQEGNNSIVTIPVKKSSDVVVGQLNGQMVKYMESKEAVLEIKTENITYTLPASQINIDSVSDKIGKQIELKDITVDVKISASPDATVKLVEDTAAGKNYKVVLKPVDFDITCHNGTSRVDVTKFNGYVERLVAIPDGIDPTKITTGIVYNPDGTFSHVPTQITVIDGKYHAKINSLTNSTYSVIWSPKTFADVQKHWAKTAIDDMGSRLVVEGNETGSFEPEKDITRAEFASIVVAGLGLMRPGTGESAFADVQKGKWYYDAVSIASEYGLVSGYGNGKFGPNDKITREQAITIISKAMDITGLKVQVTSEEQEKLLSAFGDGAQAIGYSKKGIAACIKAGLIAGRGKGLIAPKDNITKAEVAVIVRNLLQKSKLI